MLPVVVYNFKQTSERKSSYMADAPCFLNIFGYLFCICYWQPQYWSIYSYGIVSFQPISEKIEWFLWPNGSFQVKSRV